MKDVFSLFSIRRLSGQLTVLLLATLLLGLTGSTAAYYMRTATDLANQRTRIDARALAATVRLISETETADDEALILGIAARAFPTLMFEPTMIEGYPPEPGTYWSDLIAPELGPGFQVRLVNETWSRSDRETPLVISLPDGRRFYTVMRRSDLIPVLSDNVIFLICSAIIGVVVLLVWVARSLTRPLNDLADLAAVFDPEAKEQPVAEVRGPTELRLLAKSINAMLTRISLLMANRTMTVAAVGHDLRTPITRMRLRVEGLEDSETRFALLRDLHNMALVVDGALRLVWSQPNPMEPTNLGVLLDTICDDFADENCDVRYVGPHRLVITGQPEELYRLFSNLIENAVRYSSKVIASAETTGDTVRVTVGDNGLGIPASDREMMLQPFMKKDRSRSSAGLGLGLAIAASIAHRHGGRLTLEQSDMSGLAAVVVLPLEGRLMKAQGAVPSAEQHRRADGAESAMRAAPTCNPPPAASASDCARVPDADTSVAASVAVISGPVSREVLRRETLSPPWGSHTPGAWVPPEALSAGTRHASVRLLDQLGSALL